VEKQVLGCAKDDRKKSKGKGESKSIWTDYGTGCFRKMVVEVQSL